MQSSSPDNRHTSPCETSLGTLGPPANGRSLTVRRNYQHSHAKPRTVGFTAAASRACVRSTRATTRVSHLADGCQEQVTNFLGMTAIVFFRS